MVGYIKSRLTFKTLSAVEVSTYEVLIDSDKTSKAVINGEHQEYAGEFIYIDPYLRLIKKAAVKNNQTTLTLHDPMQMFDRDLVFNEEGPQPSTLLGFIRAKIAEIQADPDAQFNLPFLSIDATEGSASFVAPVVEDDGLFNLAEYIQSARQNGIGTEWKINPSGLQLRLFERPEKTYNIILDDGHNVLLSQAFSDATYSKLTVRQSGGESDALVWTDFIYYLTEDGEAVTEPPAVRLKGKWGTVTCRESDDPKDIAEKEFKDNAKSHKIEFYSDKQMQLYDAVNLRFPGGFIFNAKISQIKRSRDDIRTLYTCGDLPTTLEDRLAEAEKEKEKRAT